ncbi:MAG: hypothetical protein ABI237_16420 [Ginsengibacter sp.]
MQIEEIGGLVNEKIKRIDECFHKAIDNFEDKDIREFRSEIRKLKAFLHLLSMESEDGLSCSITRRMRITYGYLGIIHNFHLQLKEASEYEKKSSKHIPAFYMDMLEKEFDYWKKISKGYVDPDYDFLTDEYEILATLPDNLTNKSKINFINYTLYEIGEMSARQDEEGLNNVRKFMEDIYYNLPLLNPFLTRQFTILFDEKEVNECLKLFSKFRDKCTAIVLLQTFSTDTLEKHEKQLLKQMEYDWLCEKKEIKEQLISKLDALHITDNHLKELSLQE